MPLNLLDVLTAQQVVQQASQKSNGSDGLGKLFASGDGHQRFADHMNTLRKADHELHESKTEFRHKRHAARMDGAFSTTPPAAQEDTQSVMKIGDVDSTEQYAASDDDAQISKDTSDENAKDESVAPPITKAIGFLVSQLHHENQSANGSATDQPQTLGQLQGLFAQQQENVDAASLAAQQQLAQEVAKLSDDQQQGNAVDIGNIENALVDALGGEAKGSAQAITVADLDSNTVSLDDQKKIVNKLATQIIADAKSSAEKPEVKASDLQSAQVLTLLQDSNEDEADSGKAVQQLVPLAKEVTQQTTDQKSAQPVQQQSTSLLLAQNQQSAFGQQSGQFRQDQPGQQNGASGEEGGDIKQAQIQNIAASKDSKELLPQNQDTKPVLGGEFIKFEKIFNAAQSANNASTTQRFANPQEILAQIKFGLAGTTKSGHSVSIQLHPKELGSVDVRMETNADGKTKILVMAEKPDTLNLLQKEAHNLRDILQDALKTDPSNLSFTFQDKGDGDWRQFFSDHSQSRYPLLEASNVEDTSDITNTAMYGGGLTLSAMEGLDIRV